MPFVSDKNKFVHWPPPDANKFYRFASNLYRFLSIQFSCTVMSDSLRPHGLHHTRPSCPSPTLGIYSNSCPLSQWCHPTISSSVIPFSSSLQSFPESGSFQMSQFFASGGQSIGVSASASVLPVNIQDWFPLSSSMKSLAMTVIVSYWVCLDLVLTSTLNNHESGSSAEVFELFSVLNSFLILKCWWAENVLKLCNQLALTFCPFRVLF